MVGDRWDEFTPNEKKEEFITIMRSNFWKYLPLQTQRNIISLLAGHSGQYSHR